VVSVCVIAYHRMNWKASLYGPNLNGGQLTGSRSSGDHRRVYMRQKKPAFAIHSNSIDSTNIDTSAMDIVLPNKLIWCISVRDFKVSVCTINVSAKKAIPESHVKCSF